MKLFVSVCLQVVFVGVLWGSVSQELDPEILLDKYNSCNKKLQTIYYELETTTQYGGLKPGKRVHSLKYCSHNEKKQWIGHWTQYNEDGTVDQSSSSLLTDIYGDKMGVHLEFYNPELKSKRPPSADLVRSSLDKHVQGYTDHPPYGGSLTGRLFGSNDQSVYDLLKGASNLKLHNEFTKIIGYDTHLIEADTQYGVVKAWISPDLDYNCLRWEIIKNPNQYYQDGNFTNVWYTEWRAVYDAEKVEQIGGQYIITQARLNYKVDNGDIVLVNHTFHFNLKNIDLNPDYEALGAFKIQLPEGTVATHEEVPGIKFCWTNGKFVPDVDDYLTQILTGKHLPSFNRIKTDFGLEQTVGKRVLVCFWDMNQRPSRNCILPLSKSTQELKAKDVVVVGIQASKVDEDTLNKWVKENNVSFPVGMIEGDAEKIQFAWGVRSLPWLILTDRQHVVKAEGFGLDELSQKIAAIVEKED